MSAFRIYLTSAYKRKARFGKQSGTSINTKPHVSRFAHIGIKAAMVQACKSAMQHNAVIKAYAQRLYAKGKHEGIVMNNVRRTFFSKEQQKNFKFFLRRNIECTPLLLQ